MNYYQHHIGDFDKATRHLTRVERSLYRDLIEMYYDTELPLISDFTRLSRKVIAVTDEELEALKAVLGEFFTKQDDGFHNHRCDFEIEKYQSNSKAKSKAGKISAAKRKAKKEQNSTGVEQVCNKTQQTINHKPITNNQKKKGFIKPSPDEIKSFIAENNYNVDTDTFFNHYETIDWKVGKNKMKDWKASIRGWHSRNKEKGNEKCIGFDSRSRARKVSDKLTEIGLKDIEENGFAHTVDSRDF